MRNNYSAPHLEQVKIEAEMPVMAVSGATKTTGNLASFTWVE